MSWNSKFSVYAVIGFFYQIVSYGIIEYSNHTLMYILHILFWPMFIILHNIILILAIIFILFNVSLVAKHFDYKAWKIMFNEFVTSMKYIFRS